MSYFPFFMDIEAADALVVGGGTVALRKVQKLMPYGPVITVCAPVLCPELESISDIRVLREPFDESMLAGRDFVIAATDVPELNHRISDLCREAKIPVNVVDDREYCSFLFPSLVKAGELSIGISTGGASPSAAIYMRKQIEELIPENIDSIIAMLDELRPCFKASLASEAERAEVYKELFALCLSLKRPLSEAELEIYLTEKGISRYER